VKILSPQDFEGYVADALDTLPPELAGHFDNVVVVVEDENEQEPDILGLYDGLALTEGASTTAASCRTGSASTGSRCASWPRIWNT